MLQTTTGTQVLLPGSDMIGAYDPANGKDLARHLRRLFGGAPPGGWPRYGVLHTGFDRAKAMAVQLGGKGDVTETHGWVLPKAPVHSTWYSPVMNYIWYPTVVLPVA